jgi:RHS repeat-associated protein
MDKGSQHQRESSKTQEQSSQKSDLLSPPSISLPKGGGAVHGIGEKFAANSVTGTGSMSVPIATSPGRSGFNPQLLLSYDSGAGNGPFGLGWNLSLPSITRKTDKGLPRYNDAENSDVFILSGAEDLVPVLDANLNQHKDENSDPDYNIFQYRPRIEGLFALIERWQHKNTGESLWRTISKDNITTIYGKTGNARIFDPADNTRIFTWHICESYDDKGNAIVYEYKPEDDVNLNNTLANERNRIRSANRFIKRIKYGNKSPRQDNEDLSQRDDWLFEVVFDYGEHLIQEDATNQKCTIDYEGNTQTWPVRLDPFSNYRSGFEVRNYRICQRVLMFHHFEAELGIKNYLVKSTEFNYDESPVFSLINKVTQSGYELDSGNTFHKRSLPPVEFTYTKAKINETVEPLDDDSLRNLPEGLEGIRYQWVDLDGEGLTGILTEQADAWYYKRNLGDGKFAEQELVTRKPSLAALSSGRQQLLDLAGDGQLDLVELDRPLSGFYERTTDENWEPFVEFKALPNITWQDPNLKFIDLTGDGHADVLISENDVFTWYESLAEIGFTAAQRVQQALEEESGPRLVFADGTQSIYLSDMSGDGLTDLVRIRNGEVCYWPNLGYGRFGAKVTMDNSPRFDYADQFDQRRIRLADIDGSGVIDIIYLAVSGINLYFNQSGNGFSPVKSLNTFPKTDNLSSVQVADLFGNGTACLLWSSPLPGAARSPLRYIDLMGGKKPHLLIETNNNLGGITQVEYVASTQFYLKDKTAGTPWITKLPFPVHVVAKVTAKDNWRGTEFSSTYSYHHGYFDGFEREFRGFGRVEQIDVENYYEFLKGNVSSPYITDNHQLYQPPIKTITWYHTGAAVDRKRILTQFEKEYFPAKYSNDFPEKPLPEPELPPDLNAEEWREALRACKGMVLRQESYELDVDAIAQGQQIPVRLYSAATHNCNIQLLQKQGNNKHAVFLVTESEAITYNYELGLIKSPGQSDPLSPDPRIAHTLNLRHDKYGNPQQSIVIGYPRFRKGQNSNQPNPGLIDAVQAEEHIAYSEIRYTDDCLRSLSGGGVLKHHRLRLPCEVLTYELKGFKKETTRFYYHLEDFRAYDLSEIYGHGRGEIPPIKPVAFKGYHEFADGSVVQKRLVEHARSLYFNDEDNITQIKLHEFGKLGPRGLKYEDYKLALTNDLLDAVFQQRDAANNIIDNKLAWSIDSGKSVRDYFDDPIHNGSPYLKSGYILGTGIDPNLTGQYWMRSGTAGFKSIAELHRGLPNQYTDPFGNQTKLEYDPFNLFIQSSTDAKGNTSQIKKFDYRVLAPRELVDANGNHSEVVFDVLGLPIAGAIKGKETPPASGQWEGDDLKEFDFALRNPSSQAVQAFCLATEIDKTTARAWLGNATTRFVYHFGNKDDQWEQRMAGASSIAREQHKAPNSKLQVSLECSDGSGNVLMKKIQAEPAPGQTGLRWIINGLTVLNNKGKPVKQYEPYFSEQGFGCEMPSEKGVTPIIYYDAAGRTISTEMPDGTFSRVEFSPWHVKTFDANDTAFDPAANNPKHSEWFLRRTDPNHPLYTDFNPTENQRAADLVKVHANTPAITLLDSLGRDVISIAHNRIEDAAGTYTVGTKKYRDEYYTTFTKLDAEGKPLWIRDAMGHLVMQYITPPKPNNDPGNNQLTKEVPCYDIAGNLLFQHSMDAGDRWTINDAAGKPMFAWDVYKANDTATEDKRLYSTEYDALHRPIALKLKVNNAAAQVIERFVYQDAQPSLTNKNLNGQMTHHYDASGLVQTIALDFKGNTLQVNRRLVQDATTSVTDWQGNLDPKLSTETFSQITEYDALNRMTRLYNWHKGVGSNVAVYEPQYSERGTLFKETLIVQAQRNNATTGNRYDVIAGKTQSNEAIKEISYDAKGQRQYLILGNGTITQYDYDPETFRLRQLRTTRLKGAETDPGFPDFSSNLADARVVQQLLYTYDPVGNISEIQDQAYKPVFFANAIIEPRTLYEYDALYRLIWTKGRESAQGGEAARTGSEPAIANGFPITDQTLRVYQQKYQYDAVGNFLTMQHIVPTDTASGWTRRYHYAFDDTQQPASNRLWRTWQGSDTWGGGTATNKVTYTYDSHGSMLNLANVSDIFKMQWDHRDMIASINLGGGGVANYQYDAGKQRTRKTITKNNGHTFEERIYLGGLELYRRVDNGVLKEEIETLHLFDGEQRLLMVDQILKTDNSSLGTRTLYRYTLSNHLGSSTVELDEQAGIISYEEYHPYGTSAYRAGRNAAEVKLKRYRYTGMERDEESGLSYHTARYYMPWLGRWGSGDPVGIRDGVNLYVYSHQNPIRFTDKEGKEAKKPYDPKMSGKTGTEAVKAAKETLAGNKAVIIEEGVVQTGKGGSRIDLIKTWVKNLTQFIEAWEVKGVDLKRYLQVDGTVDIAKLEARFTKYFQQIYKHRFAMFMEDFINPATGEAIEEHLKVFVKNASKEQLKQARDSITQLFKKMSHEYGLNINAEVESMKKSVSGSKGSAGKTGGHVSFGTLLNMLGWLAAGLLVHQGISEIKSGETALGVTSLMEAATNLLLQHAPQAVLTKHGSLIAGGGAGSVAVASLTAGASLFLMFSTIRSAIKHEETPVETADKFWGTGFGNIYSWQQRSSAARVGLTGGLSAVWNQLMEYNGRTGFLQ